MNKKIAAFMLTALTSISLLPISAYASTLSYNETQESGVIVRDISEEETAAESEIPETAADTGGSGGTTRNEDGSVTQRNSTAGTGSSRDNTSGSTDITRLLSSLNEETVETEEKKIGTVITDGSVLNVRSGGGLDYGVIDTLNNGDTVEVLEDHGDWLYVSIPEHTGYVCADYMDVRTVPVEVKKDGSLSFSLDPELIKEMLENAEESGAEITSSELGLTPEGNLTLVDDYGTGAGAGKQFITLVTKSGNYFYLIIDRDEDGNETVHFLNQVDEDDLFALMDKDAVTEMKEEIAAEEAAREAAEKAAREEPETYETQENTKSEKYNGVNPLLLILPLLLVFGGIGGYLYLNANRAKANHPVQDPDADYMDDGDLDIYEIPEEPDPIQKQTTHDTDTWFDDIE